MVTTVFETADSALDGMAEELVVYRPVDGSVMDRVSVDGTERVVAIAAALRDAQGEWEALGIAGRSVWLARLRDWLLDNTDRLAEIMHAETGKVRAEVVLELNWVCDIINTYLRLAPKLLGEQRVRARSPLMLGKRFTVVRRPFPLVGVIGAWNFPIVLTLGDAVPALLAGAAILAKPSELTPLTVREIARGWREIGAPPVLAVAYGAGTTGAALIDAVDFVQFTGSVGTGRRVAERAARTLTPVSLELGGKDPFIVLRGANLERAARCAVVAAFTNNGQVCLAAERFYVEDSIHDEFAQRVTELVRALRVGVAAPGAPIDVGPMISPGQIAIVDEQVRDAVGKGARVLTGGHRVDRAGSWYEPTVLADVDHRMSIMREETFGPVLPIVRVADAEEAVRMANDSEFGLGATLFAKSVEQGERLARRIDCGSVNINDFAVATMCMEVPMGGWKRSGIGARSGAYGILKYTRTKSISVPRIPERDSEIWWLPYDSRRSALVERAFRFVNARGRRRFAR